MIYSVNEVVEIASSMEVQIKGKWVPARPVGYRGFYGIIMRIKAALLVLNGKADAVTWGGEQ